MPNIEETVTALEKINEVVDLCIDRELFNYGYLKNEQILFFDKEAEAHLNELQRGKKNISYKSFLFDYPITDVRLPKNIVGPRLSEYTRNISLKRKGDKLKPWSNIFWAKRLRAEILKRNNDEWNKSYDDIIFFMEKNIPLNKPSQSPADKRTLFNYIMELAALSLGEGSLGYVDRARNIFNKEDLDPYISWLGWNSGTAWQHMGYSQRAVREYNWVISNLYKKVKLNKLFEDHKKFLEFLLNVWPAIIQRASIQLKLQLSYHAVRTLDDKYIKHLKNEIGKEKSKLFIHSFRHLELQTKLLKIESLLQLEDFIEAKANMSSIINDIFPGSKWSESYLPEFNSSSPFHVFQIQLTEHIIAMHLEELRQSSKDAFKSKDIEFVCNLFNYIRSKYWDQVRDNIKDKLVYFSRWAQYLMVGITIYTNGKLNAKDKTELLKAIKNMYVRHRNLLPICYEESRKIGNRSRRLKLYEFVSDDFPDFVGGLSEFYKKISEIEKEKLERLGNEKLTIKNLAIDHRQILKARGEYERDFGEKRRITALDRYNESLIWKKNNSNCVDCLNKSDKTRFVNLLNCANILKSSKYELKGHDYENIMKQAEEHLFKHLSSRTIHKNNNGKNNAELHFLGLQRWNSLTPAQGYSVGGGYFIYRTDTDGRIDLGIAIDPGFDFVRNLFKMGFSLKDIDVILISHAHADHIWDFESLVQLANELSKKKEKDKGKRDHRFNVILSLGSYRRVEHIINNPVLRRFVNPLIIDIRKEIDPDLLDVSFERRSDGPGWRPILGGNFGDIRIKCTTAYHDDYSDRSDSFGFILEFGNERSGIIFGYTGDTKWVSDDLYRPLIKGNILKAVSKQYVDCDVLLLHLGSLINHRVNEFSTYNSVECIKMIRKENHLYLMGTIRFLKRLKRDDVSYIGKRLILLGEFGEELRGGIRKDIVQRLQGILANKWKIIPVDVGLDVLMSTSNNDDNGAFKYKRKIKGYQFFCTLCDRYHPIGDIDYLRYGEDEAIFHVCQTCAKALPDDVRQNKFRKIYEVGKEIRT